MGIEEIYLNIRKDIYNTPTANIILTSEELKTFLLNSGTRQSCRLSPLLFSIVWDVLATATRQEKYSFQTWREEAKLSLFGDYMILTVEKLKSPPQNC